MAKPGRQSFEKRLREKKKKEKAQEKQDRKAQRKADKDAGIISDGDIDYSLAQTTPDGRPIHEIEAEAEKTGQASVSENSDSAPATEASTEAAQPEPPNP